MTEIRTARALRALTAVLALCAAACDFGSGSSGGGGAARGGDDGGGAPSSATATLSWAAASGPVAGYAVYVKRNGGEFQREKEVSSPSVTLEGEVGDFARIVVAAFTGSGLMGPLSPPSEPFYFGDPAVSAVQSSPSSAAASLAGGSSGQPSAGYAAVAPEPAEPVAEPDAEPARERVPAQLAGGLVWLADGALRVTDASLETLLLSSAPEGAELVGAGDFDGDAAPELLWAESGVLSTTPLVGPAAGERTGFGLLEPGERVAGLGDLDGDGLVDLVLVGADGSVRSWLTATGAVSEPLGQTGGDALLAVDDFDGDGAADLLWRSPGGVASLWLMDGARLHASFALPLAADLEAAGAGDFDGDGEAELALRDPGGALWLYEPLDDTLQAAGAADAGLWRPAGAADLDGDGRDELVLAGAASLRVTGLPDEGGGSELPLEPGSPWSLAAVLP